MKPEVRRFEAFCMGSLAESERLGVERELLADVEALLDFLDTKRALEGARAIPSRPSARLWSRLDERAPRRRAIVASLSLGGALAAGLAAAWFLSRPPVEPATAVSPSPARILFDGPSEPAGSSGVL